jgi:hypothetical protein
MMYSNKLVCSVKVGRKILREKVENNESTVFVPFGSEYSLLLKNLGGRNAVVHIEIDGRKVSENGFYMRAGQTADIERFVESLTEGRRFKFIEKTEEISDFRGDKVDDGIIRVTWQFERPAPEMIDVTVNHHHNHYNAYHHGWGCRCPFCNPPSFWYGPMWSNTSSPLNNITYTSQNIGSSISGGGGTTSSCFNSSIGKVADRQPEQQFYKSDEPAPGITVEGSKSFQQFGTAYASALETNVHSMIIILKGTRGHVRLYKPVVVREKFECSTCGRKWHSNYEFCANCGTALRK